MTKEKEKDIKDNFWRILSTNADLTELCDFLASCIGIPTALSLPTRTLIARSGDFSDSLLLEFTSSQSLCSKDELLEIDEKIHSTLKPNEPIVIIWPYLRYKYISLACYWHDLHVADINCPIVKADLPEDANDIISIASTVFIIALRLNGYIDNMTSEPSQELIIGLLKGKIERDYQHVNLYHYNIFSVKYWRILICKPLGKTQEKDQVRLIANSICTAQKDMWCVEFQNYIIILIADDNKSALMNLKHSAANICRIGVSEKFEDIFSLKTHADNVVLGMQIAEFAEDNDSIIYTEKYKTIAKTISLLKSDKNDLVSPTIKKIKEYDLEHNSEYYITLKSYLLHQRNYEKVSAHIHLHKNTVIYRIRRITELFDIDFKDVCTISSLYISLFAEM